MYQEGERGNNFFFYMSSALLLLCPPPPLQNMFRRLWAKVNVMFLGESVMTNIGHTQTLLIPEPNCSFVADLSLIFLSFLRSSGPLPGSLISMVRLNMAVAGATSMVVCGIALSFRRNLNISCFQGLPSILAACTTFPRFFMNCSHSTFAHAHLGVICLCLKPMYEVNILNSVPLKGGPLSIFSTLGIPELAKTLYRTGIMALALVE